MPRNLDGDYKLYYETLCDKIKVTYIIFAVFSGLISFILALLISWLGSTGQIHNIINGWLISDKNYLCIVAYALTLIMTRRLRDKSASIFLDPKMPFNPIITYNMQHYLSKIFSPYKYNVGRALPLKPPKWWPFFYVNHIYMATFISLVAGILGYHQSMSEPFYTVEFGVMGERVAALGWAIGCALGSFVFTIWACIILGILTLLREVSNVQRDYEIKHKSEIIQLKNLDIISMNILYSYAVFMISLPSVIGYILKGDMWLITNIFILISAIVGLILVLFVPNYYIHLIIKAAKDDYVTKISSRSDDLEDKIISGSATDLDVLKYSAFIHNVESVELIRTWPSDLENIAKILVTIGVGLLPIIWDLIRNIKPG